MRGEPWEWTHSDDADDQTRTLRDYVGMVLQSWKLVLFIVSLAALAGLYFALTAPPVFETNALIHVEEKPGSSLQDALDPISMMYGNEALGSAETEILRSRSVLQKVVSDLKLDISAEPHYLGAIGATVARFYERLAPSEDPSLLRPAEYLRFDNDNKLSEWTARWIPYLSRYAWGGERIIVSRLDVPRAYEGQQLMLTAGGDGVYEVKDEEGQALLKGEVGEAARGETPMGVIEMYVAELKARPSTEFLVTKRPMPVAIDALLNDFSVVEKGAKTGILALSLKGPSPEEVKARLNAIAESYLAQNVARESEEAKRTLQFINSQLPQLRENVDSTEAALRDYQAENGTVDLSLEAQKLLDDLTKVEGQISQLSLKRAGMSRLYTDDHPVIKSIDDKRARLEEASALIEEQLKKLPDVESDYLKLSRDAKVANQLYLLLLNKGQELKVVEAGVTGYVRIIDHAFEPLMPSGPNRARILFVAVVLGFMIAIGLLLLRQALARALETPEPIERKLGIPVYATIPHSKQQADLCRAKRKRGVRSGEPEVLARSAGNDVAIESLRSLRTSLQFALIENKNNVVTITGPTPGLGKTFVAVNLTFLLGDIDKRVLLIDGDMRRGHMHKYLGLSRSPGLSDVIAGRCRAEQAIHPIDGGKVHFMSTGTLPPNPSELLVHDNFRQLIERVSEKFDLVMIDTPPILNLTDGIVIGRHSGTNFLVVRGGQSNLHEVELSIRRMQQSDIKLSGVIFNGLQASATKYGYGKYGYYAYQYNSAKTEA
jgi:tyrosine-protein kinase Etk/Wzc